MRLTVLEDNNTFIDRYLLAEPALSILLEEDGRQILFDTGYSDVFLENARRLSISLSSLEYVVISHGHNDHTNGLEYLKPEKPVTLVSHPDCFTERYEDGIYIGPPCTEEEIASRFQHIRTAEPYWISDRLLFLGEIERTLPFEPSYAMGTRVINGKTEADYLTDDSALAYLSADGLFIITGCSHSGICNIIEYARKVTGEERVAGVIGGFHLFEADSRLEETISYLSSLEIKDLYPCHCVSLLAKARMIMAGLNVTEVGSGLQFTI